MALVLSCVHFKKLDFGQTSIIQSKVAVQLNRLYNLAQFEKLVPEIRPGGAFTVILDLGKPASGL